jgi:hypothetical protein
MKKYGIDIDKNKFCDFLASKFDWFGVTIDQAFPELSKEGEPMSFRRIDHLLSDIDVDGRRIILNVQEGDPFIESAKVFLPTMNSFVMKKTEHFFVLNTVSYF